MANFCSNCGAPLNGGKFCSECGTPVADSTQVNHIQAVSNSPDYGLDDDALLEKLFVETGANKSKMCKLYAREKGLDLAVVKAVVDSFMDTKTFSEKCAANREFQRRGMAAAQQMPPITKRGKVKQRIAENKANGIACCPKCGSTSLSANKKGFSIGKAIVGAALVGDIGLSAGNIGAKKVVITCLSCGHQFKPEK